MAPRGRRGKTGGTASSSSGGAAADHESGCISGNGTGNRNRSSSNDPDYGDEVEELPPLVSDDINGGGGEGAAAGVAGELVTKQGGSGSGNSNHHHQSTHSSSSGNGNRADNASSDDDDDNVGGGGGDGVGGGTGGDGGTGTTCLHCQSAIVHRDNVQVRCDECGSSICHGCHWCHEFQANHEIRVCDRCDAFYCRACDEMDQCDDCGEVVCAACSTLLSCKFCGGGLCEDCATACGRCGIVLCSRDAKFAVDCDTCRLSYCLVCLASGSKDPCVRCGHRPSKRMEQLVHLRLKSIYKAFKQSSGSGSPKAKSSSNVRERQNDDPDECHHVAEDPEALLQAAAASAAKNSASRKARNKHASSSPHHGAVPPYHGSSGAAAGTSTTSSNSDDEDEMEQYIAEKQKADAAAAALLAELEEEEEAAKKKTKKKKKKKKSQKSDDDHGGSASSTLKDAPGTGKQSHLKKPPPDGMDDDDYDDEEVLMVTDEGKLEPRKAESTELSARSATTDEEDNQAPLDPLERKLCELVADEDIEGLEELLTSVKGVPGRATLRKNAKKALKRFRAAAAELEAEMASNGNFDEGDFKPVVHKSSSNAGSEGPTRSSTPIMGEGGIELLKIVTQTHSKPGPRGGPNSANRTECIMHMSPLIVGWVIGKGGTKIRDLMEETGARIWIDQDSTGPTVPRTVYVSGQRKNVDAAVVRITEMVSHAPLAVGNKLSAADFEEILASKPKTAADSETAQATKPRGHKPDKNRSEHVMTCDPRFVPLLIGRRGWTIKNIQDSSGARVDIDQTVTPRKITISGTPENVQAAIRMVNDVLSYPHAQLQGPGDDGEEGDVEEVGVAPAPAANGTPVAVAEAQPTENAAAAAAPVPAEKEPAAPADIAPAHALSPAQNSAPLDNANAPRLYSPPSSLIMTGDAKSTISASSSLSSTPEPSTAPSNKNNLLQVPSGPMLPPSFGFGSYNPTPGGAVAAPQQQPQALLPNAPAFPPSGIPPGAPPQQDSSLFGITSSPPAMRPLVQSAGTGSSSIPVTTPTLSELVSSPTQQQQPLAMRQPAGGPAFEQRGVGGLGEPLVAGSSPLPGVHHQQQGAFHPPQQQTGFRGMPVASPQPAATTALLNGSGNQVDSGSLPNGGLWDRPSGQPADMMRGVAIPNPAASQRPDGFRLDAAVDFLQHSKHSGPPAAPGGLGEAIGLPPPSTGAATSKQSIGLDRGGTAAATNPMAALSPEDSRMIDNLFGPSTTAPPANDPSLLSGLQNLSMGKDSGLSGTGLWGSAVVGGEELKGFNSLGGVGEPKTTSNIFETDPTGQQNQPKSHFGWGAFGAEGQQS